MTAIRRDGKEQDEFREWLRRHPLLDSVRNGWVQTDCDLLIHKYKNGNDRLGQREVQCMMWIEYKQFGADLTKSQEDTLGQFHEMFNERRRRVKSRAIGRRVTLWFFGVHLLRMSDATPDTSEWLEWNRKRITLEKLLGILNFNFHPFTMEPLSVRRHHAERNGRLF